MGGAVDRIRQLVVSLLAICDQWHDGDPQTALQQGHIDALSLTAGHVHHVEHEHAGDLDTSDVGQHVEASRKLRRIGHDHDDVYPTGLYVVLRDALLLRLGGQAVASGKVAELVARAIARKAARLLLHGLPWPVAHMLVRSRQPVKEGGLARVRLPEQGKRER